MLCIFVSTATIAEESSQSPSAGEQEELSELELELLDEEKKKLFQIGYQSFNEKNYPSAIEDFYRYMEKANSGDENYEWAQFFFGVSLDKLGYSHAAVDTFTQLVTRKPNTKIVIYILSMFDVVSRKQPFDEDLLIAQALNSTDYGFIDDELAALVHYYQGIYDWKFGLREWANEHFKKIPENSYYYSKTQYHLARNDIYSGNIDTALDTLYKILASPVEDQKLIDLVHWTAARTLFEKGEYEKALAHYQDIETPVAEQASFLLERAWNQFNLNKPERAMGLLYAFEAPNFKRFFSPELFILKSIIYKSLCHFDSTLAVVEDFKTRYDTALSAIYDRRDAADSDTHTLLLLILNDEMIKARWDFLQLLEKESSQIDDIKDKNLRDYLEKVYALKIEQNSKSLRIDVDQEFERLANELLEYEENINLVRYEAGVDKYQSANDTLYNNDKKPTAKKDLTNRVVYAFQGEFWNDELDDYKVLLENQCNKDQTWDVFFE